VRLVIARCTVDYAGRLTAHLPSANRLLLVKADGSVSVHADDRAYKPLNWMSPPCWLTEEADRWVVRNKADETLTITLEDVQHDSQHELGVDPGLVKDGVEAHLQVLLAQHVATLGEGWTLVRREFPTAIGPVDLMCRDADGGSVAVEIKRRGDRRRRAADPLPRAAQPRPAARARGRGVRGAADQAAGPHARDRPGHPVRDPRLRRAARRRGRRVPALLTVPGDGASSSARR
jgi:endonuclease